MRSLRLTTVNIADDKKKFLREHMLECLLRGKRYLHSILMNTLPSDSTVIQSVNMETWACVAILLVVELTARLLRGAETGAKLQRLWQ